MTPKKKTVLFKDILESREWKESRAALPIALGRDMNGNALVKDLTKLRNVLIAGIANSGKTNFVSVIINSLLYSRAPEDLRLLMFDPAGVELKIYNLSPHMLAPVETDPRKTSAFLEWLVGEMERRFEVFRKARVRNIEKFNEKIAAENAAQSTAETPIAKLPYIVCVINELADSMCIAGEETELHLARLAQLSYAAGIHLIVATRHPDPKILTDFIKNDFPTRVAFKVSSQVDSVMILGREGAERLPSCGDMLFMDSESSEPIRAQSAHIGDSETQAAVAALKANGTPEYCKELLSFVKAKSNK